MQSTAPPRARCDVAPTRHPRARFGVTLPGGGGFRVIAGLVASRLEHHRVDAPDVSELGQRFDLHASDTPAEEVLAGLGPASKRPDPVKRNCQARPRVASRFGRAAGVTALARTRCSLSRAKDSPTYRALARVQLANRRKRESARRPRSLPLWTTSTTLGGPVRRRPRYTPVSSAAEEIVGAFRSAALRGDAAVSAGATRGARADLFRSCRSVRTARQVASLEKQPAPDRSNALRVALHRSSRSLFAIGPPRTDVVYPISAVFHLPRVRGSLHPAVLATRRGGVERMMPGKLRGRCPSCGSVAHPRPRRGCGNRVAGGLARHGPATWTDRTIGPRWRRWSSVSCTH